jgi:predicted GNAT superfamily acetyltransferase
VTEDDDGPEATIRPIEGTPEYKLCEELQKEVWSYTDREVVPKNELLAAVRSGGSLLGAWQGDQLIAFSYGMAGFDGKTPYLSSRLVAVKNGIRSKGLGERMKRAQRKHALELGYERIEWTQDPLQAANARLNFRKLGAVARSYVLDYYGATTSPLHGSLPTDRLEVEWEIASPRVARRLGEQAGIDPSQVPADPGPPFTMLDAIRDSSGVARPGRFDPAPPHARSVRIAVPSNVNEILAKDPGLALAWRMATREAFVAAFERGFVLTDFVSTRPDEGPGDARYVLTRET